MNPSFTEIFGHFSSLTSALAVLTAMITPALLIMASGTFIVSTSNRLGRVVDRVRVVAEKIALLMHERPDAEMLDERRVMLFEQLERLSRRARLLQRSLTVLYLASAVFVATSVAIGFIAIAGSLFSWMPVFLGVGGACLLFYGSVLLILEARLALSSVDSEMDFLQRLAREHPERPVQR